MVSFLLYLFIEIIYLRESDRWISKITPICYPQMPIMTMTGLWPTPGAQLKAPFWATDAELVEL